MKKFHQKPVFASFFVGFVRDLVEFFYGNVQIVSHKG